jgi:hypothetical protein
MEVKSYSLKGQPLVFKALDYERAYFSSFLRSLKPMNYPGIVLYPLMNRIEILRPVIKNLINFSLNKYYWLLFQFSSSDVVRPRYLPAQMVRFLSRAQSFSLNSDRLLLGK